MHEGCECRADETAAVDYRAGSQEVKNYGSSDLSFSVLEGVAE